MAEQPKSTRRQFLKTCARCAGVAAAGAAAVSLTMRADADKVWQLSPDTCSTCAGFRNASGWGRCSTECVLPRSAVRAVNDFGVCGYCFICPAYFDVSSDVYTYQEAQRLGPYPDGTTREGTHKKILCPQDAIVRRVVGMVDPHDPYNNFFEYAIDETRCNGCGLCVEACKPPAGNASLRLEVRHNLCVDCNQCAIAARCPTSAFYRSSLIAETPGYAPKAKPADKGSHS